MWSRLVAEEDRHGSTAKGSSPCALELHTHMRALPGLWTKLIWGLRGRDEFKVRPSVCLVVTPVGREPGKHRSPGSIAASSVLGGGGDSSGLELQGAHEAELDSWRLSPFLEEGSRPTLGPPRFKGSTGTGNTGAKGITRQHEKLSCQKRQGDGSSRSCTV